MNSQLLFVELWDLLFHDIPAMTSCSAKVAWLRSNCIRTTGGSQTLLHAMLAVLHSCSAGNCSANVEKEVQGYKRESCLCCVTAQVHESLVAQLLTTWLQCSRLVPPSRRGRALTAASPAVGTSGGRALSKLVTSCGHPRGFSTSSICNGCLRGSSECSRVPLSGLSWFGAASAAAQVVPTRRMGSAAGRLRKARQWRWRGEGVEEARRWEGVL